MVLHALRRLRRTPVPAIGVLLFTAALSIVLCSLQRSNDAELKKYNETYHTIPVQVSITNLSGTSFTNLGISNQFAEFFAGEDCLGKYLTDLQKVCSHSIQGAHFGSKLVGVTSLELSPELWAENGTMIEWKNGQSEQVFSGNEPVCLIPNALSTQTDKDTGAEYVELLFEVMGRDELKTHTLRLQVAGTYRGGDGKTIYCPYPTCAQVFTEFNEFMAVQSLRATLKNNDDLETLRAESKRWFAEPNPLGEKTPYEGNEFLQKHYPFALSINDELLQRAAATLQTSITTNRICSVIVLVLSATAGFLIGFLMVRNRKKEIALMRTLGTPNSAVYFGFVIEQMLCVIFGIVFGGAHSRWHPIDHLGFLAVVYFVGLTVALLIFLRKNLLTTIKEDE